MEKILEVKDVTKKFGPVTVFHDVNLELYQGEILSLVGENGAGKSTLMNVLGGVYAIGEYEGEIYVEGKKQTFRNEAESKAAGIEMIHQEISLHLELTVAENIFLGNLDNKKGWVNWKKVYERAQEYLDMVKLDVPPKEKVMNLSTSQQQLLSIAKALACHPKIILFDEPTSALTETDAENLINIIQRLAKDGMSCIYISHRMEEIMRLSDRIAVLRDGNLISVNKKSEVTVDQIIEDMVGRKLDEMYPKQILPIGDKSDDAVMKFYIRCMNFKPDVVHILIGTNDLRHNDDKNGMSALSLHDYRRNLSYMIHVLKEAGIPVVVSQISPVMNERLKKRFPEDNWKYVYDEIRELNKIVCEVAEESGAKVNAMEKIYAQYEAGELLLQDGLHLNEKGQYLLAKNVLESLREYL